MKHELWMKQTYLSKHASYRHIHLRAKIAAVHVKHIFNGLLSHHLGFLSEWKLRVESLDLSSYGFCPCNIDGDNEWMWETVLVHFHCPVLIVCEGAWNQHCPLFWFWIGGLFWIFPWCPSVSPPPCFMQARKGVLYRKEKVTKLWSTPWVAETICLFHATIAEGHVWSSSLPLHSVARVLRQNECMDCCGQDKGLAPSPWWPVPFLRSCQLSVKLLMLVTAGWGKESRRALHSAQAVCVLQSLGFKSRISCWSWCVKVAPVHILCLQVKASLNSHCMEAMGNMKGHNM